MRTITITYQIYSVCSREISVPDDFQFTDDYGGFDSFKELREKIPDHEIWDEIPEGDCNGDLYIEDHLDYISGSGLDLHLQHDNHAKNFSVEFI